MFEEKGQKGKGLVDIDREGENISFLLKKICRLKFQIFIYIMFEILDYVILKFNVEFGKRGMQLK